MGQKRTWRNRSTSRLKERTESTHEKILVSSDPPKSNWKKTIAECYRLVAEQEAKLPPYDFALFLQRLDRKIYARMVKRTTRIVDGDCVVIEPASFVRQRK